jgi:phage regulator Rha-like protein
MMGVGHSDILKKLEGTPRQKGIIPVLCEGNFPLADYFQESTYQDAQNKPRKCYQVTRMGCDFLANKFTGEKGILFTAKYVKRFHEMEDTIHTLRKENAESLKIKAQQDRAKAMLLNAQNRVLKTLMFTIQDKKLSPVATEVFGLKSIEEVTGIAMGNYLPQIEKTYTATEVGAMFGVSANKVGSIANRNGIKTEQYGITVMDKSPYSAKEVSSFRYNEKGVAKIKELIGNNK